MTEEVKEKVKKEPKKFHHLYDWVLLAVALLVILGGPVTTCFPNTMF
jgi:hypothetical protein